MTAQQAAWQLRPNSTGSKPSTDTPERGRLRTGKSGRPLPLRFPLVLVFEGRFTPDRRRQAFVKAQDSKYFGLVGQTVSPWLGPQFLALPLKQQSAAWARVGQLCSAVARPNHRAGATPARSSSNGKKLGPCGGSLVFTYSAHVEA